MSVQYLTKSPQGFYSYRRAVPPELRDTIGRREIKKAFGTTDYVKAVALHAKVHAETERLFTSAKTATPPGERELVLRELKKLGFSPKEIEAFAKGRDWDLDLEGYWYGLVNEYEDAEARNVKPPVSLATIAAIGERKLPPVVHTIATALDHYLSLKRTGIAVKDKQLENRVRHLKERLVEVIGKEAVNKRRLEEFTRAEARQFRDFLAGVVSPKSVVRTLEILSPAINKMIKEHELDMRNPILGLEVKGAVSSRDDRLPLSDDDMQALGPVMVKKDGDALGAIWSTLRDTGARLGEVANLRGMDVSDDHGGYIHIRPYGDHTLKTKNSERMVPVSPVALAALGAHVSNREAPIFAKYAGPRQAEKASAALMKRLRTVVGNPKKSVHSLRHRMKDSLRNTSCPLNIADEIQGHCAQTTSYTYGSGPALKIKREALEKVWSTGA